NMPVNSQSHTVDTRDQQKLSAAVVLGATTDSPSVSRRLRRSTSAAELVRSNMHLVRELNERCRRHHASHALSGPQRTGAGCGRRGVTRLLLVP
ncbi:hypothetical protein, partial [Segeticoccus rhizosphaerae]|uniref:hypothetical protein n=1 Tax=Segeticoccus rhizosphaerae TaxID=1104777 RepID=UPI001EE3C897